jgi:hypothetical protein
VTGPAEAAPTGPDEINDRHGYAQPTLAQYEDMRQLRNEARDAIREALLTIQLWAEGSYQRGKTDADTIFGVQRILEAVDV